MKGKIYFVSAPGRIKIGYTRKPEIRLKQLRSIDMEPLEVIGVADGSTYIERRLHKMVGDHRIRGEWFRDCAEVRELASNYLGGKIKLDEFGQDEWVDEVDAACRAGNAVRSDRKAFLDCVAEAHRLVDEIESRMVRGEPISDLVKAACFLANHVVAPKAVLERTGPEE